MATITPSLLAKSLDLAIKNGFPILVKGAPGIGKTDILVQACKDAKADLIIEHPVVSDPTDYKGLPFPSKAGDVAHFLPFGSLMRILEDPDPNKEAARNRMVFFLDDLGQATPAVQAACMQLILGRRINGFKVSDKVVFMAATNRKEDKAAVAGILEPVKSRFMSIVELVPNLDDWVRWAVKHDMPPELVAFIRFSPKQLTQFKATADMVNTPCPRTIAHVGKLVNAGVLNKEYADVKYSLISGAAGEGFATEFLSYLECFVGLPSIEDILSNPTRTPLPKEPSKQYAISSLAAHYASQKNFDTLMKFVNRLPTEFQVVAVMDGYNRDNAIAVTRAFTEWATINKDIFNI